MSDILYDEEGRPDRNVTTGQFVANNKWKMPAWRPGQSGRTAKLKEPNRVARLCQEYIDQQDALQKPYTLSGVARHLGMTPAGLRAYLKDGIESAHPGVLPVLQHMQAIIEEQREEQLVDKGHATTGVIFALKNHHGWRDEKHLSVESQQEQRLIVQLPPELALRLQASGAQIEHEVIEGEVD